MATAVPAATESQEGIKKPPIHLVLTEVEADIFRITGRARMLDVGNKSFPGISYTAKTFPGLTR